MNNYTVFIDGEEGTTGLKIKDYFKLRDDIDLLHIDERKRKNPEERLRFIRKSDVAFLCLPDAASKEIAAMASINDIIIDTSTAHRTMEDWAYGLPELCSGQREKIKNSTRIAVPGCHATGFILAVRPLIELQILNKDYPFSCHSITGYSGGGKKMIADYESCEATKDLLSPRQYGLMQTHKHLPEMKKMSQIDYEPIFNPIVANYFSGMLVSVPICTRFMKSSMTVDNLRKLYTKYYVHSNFVKVANDDGEIESGFLASNKLAGRNDVQLYVYGNDDRIMVAARYDNLGKGASGAAIQCMNILLGLPEETGLL